MIRSLSSACSECPWHEVLNKDVYVAQLRDCEAYHGADAAKKGMFAGRAYHSSTSQLNLSRFIPCTV